MMVVLSESVCSTLVRPKSAMHAGKLLLIKMLLFAPSAGIELQKNSTYAFQISVNGWSVMEVLQSTSDVRQLGERGKVGSLVFEGTLTSFSRLAVGNAVTKSAVVPCSIHSETIVRVCEDLVAPGSGNRFGCLNCFRSATSRRNL